VAFYVYCKAIKPAKRYITAFTEK